MGKRRKARNGRWDTLGLQCCFPKCVRVRKGELAHTAIYCLFPCFNSLWKYLTVSHLAGSTNSQVCALKNGKEKIRMTKKKITCRPVGPEGTPEHSDSLT